MSVRKFSLINSQNEVYDLNNHDVFLYDPDGLGFEEGTTYQQIADYFVPTLVKYNRWEPRGTIFFNNPGAYQKYNTFMRFIAHAPLVLIYEVSGIEYRMDVRVQQLRKTQLEIGQELRCDIRFAALSPFYRVLYDSATGSEDSGKIYSYTYSYKYRNSVEDEIELIVNGALDSPVRLEISGNGYDIVNPTWYHYQDGQLVSSGRVVATITDGKKFMVDDWSIPYRIWETDEFGNMIRDLYSASDFTTQRFMYAKPGTNRFRVAHEGLQHLTLAVSVKESYATV